MSQFVKIQGVVKIILEMEIVALFVPPALGKNKSIGSGVSRCGNPDCRGKLRYGNFRLDILRIFGTIVKSRIAPIHGA